MQPRRLLPTTFAGGSLILISNEAKAAAECLLKQSREKRFSHRPLLCEKSLLSAGKRNLNGRTACTHEPLTPLIIEYFFFFSRFLFAVPRAAKSTTSESANVWSKRLLWSSAGAKGRPLSIWQVAWGCLKMNNKNTVFEFKLISFDSLGRPCERRA